MKATPRIVITGFMGAGKTTVARELARTLASPVVSLDEAVAEIEGRGPRALIDEEGEAYFREAETRALRRALEKGSARVIDTGGGAWTLERNRRLVAEHGCLAVWLDAPFDLCWRRITSERGGEARPLAREREAARRLFEERLASYRLAPLHVRVTEGQSAAQLAARVVAAAASAT
jgi:shikimate kinase